jgi:hypothetical protein
MAWPQGASSMFLVCLQMYCEYLVLDVSLKFWSRNKGKDEKVGTEHVRK